jgi:hypothetical protein
LETILRVYLETLNWQLVRGLIIEIEVLSKKNLILIYIGIVACVATQSYFTDVMTSDE